MWEELLDWAKRNMLEGEIQFTSPGDFDIPVCVNTAEEIVEIIRKYQQKWASEQ
jgi:hypothetical protein